MCRAGAHERAAALLDEMRERGRPPMDARTHKLELAVRKEVHG